MRAKLVKSHNNKKVSDIVGNTKVDENVYNGKKKVEAQCEMFMTGLI